MKHLTILVLVLFAITTAWAFDHGTHENTKLRPAVESAEQEQMPVFQELVVTYSNCPRQLCPSNEVNAVIPGYECNCNKQGEHPGCNCENACNCEASNVHPACGCDGWTQPIVRSESSPCQCEEEANQNCACQALNSNQPLTKSFRPFAPSLGDPNPLPPIQDGECVPNVRELGPGNCRSKTQNANCGQVDSNCLAQSQAQSQSQSQFQSQMLSGSQAQLQSQIQASLSSQSLSQSQPQSQSCKSPATVAPCQCQHPAPQPCSCKQEFTAPSLSSPDAACKKTMTDEVQVKQGENSVNVQTTAFVTDSKGVEGQLSASQIIVKPIILQGGESSLPANPASAGSASPPPPPVNLNPGLGSQSQVMSSAQALAQSSQVPAAAPTMSSSQLNPSPAVAPTQMAPRS